METAAVKFPVASSSSSSPPPFLRILEIRVISGEDLRINQRRQSVKNSFVVIKTDSGNNFSSSSTSYFPGEIRRTKLNTDGGSNPEWDEKLVMEMPLHARFVTVEVQCKKNGGNNSSSSSRIIGTVKIPVSDFIGGLVPENYLHFLSYRLRDTQGERNGIINLSVRIKSPVSNTNSISPSANFSLQQNRPASGFPLPAADSTLHYNKDQGLVVTGIPVRLPNF